MILISDAKALKVAIAGVVTRRCRPLLFNRSSGGIGVFRNDTYYEHRFF